MTHTIDLICTVFSYATSQTKELISRKELVIQDMILHPFCSLSESEYALLDWEQKAAYLYAAIITDFEAGFGSIFGHTILSALFFSKFRMNNATNADVFAPFSPAPLERSYYNLIEYLFMLESQGKPERNWNTEKYTTCLSLAYFEALKFWDAPDFEESQWYFEQAQLLMPTYSEPERAMQRLKFYMDRHRME